MAARLEMLPNYAWNGHTLCTMKMISSDMTKPCLFQSCVLFGKVPVVGSPEAWMSGRLASVK